MAEYTARRPPPMPGRLKAATVIICIQAAAGLAIGFYLLDVAADEDRVGGTDGHVVLLQLIAYVAFVRAALLLACVALMRRRYSWVRATVLIIETLVIMGGLNNFTNGAVVALIDITMALVILIVMLQSETNEWFNATGRFRECPDIGWHNSRRVGGVPAPA